MIVIGITGGTGGRMELFAALRFLFVVSALSLSVNAIRKPKDISEEMFCMGCQITVKELDFMLSKKPTRGMGETVTRALKRVCDIHNFDKYDVDSKKVLKVCEHIKGDEGMEAVLITEYGRKHATGKQTTYLDMTQMICGTVLNACVEPDKLETNDEDGGIIYDPVVEDFYVKQGKKVRTPNPIQEPNETMERKSTEEAEQGDSLQNTETQGTKPDTVVITDDTHDEL